MNIKVKLLEHGVMPRKGRQTDAGFDIFLPNNVTVWPNDTAVIDTGVCVEIPYGYAGMFVIRSSISKKSVVIQPPLIDNGYTGELHIMLYNGSNQIQRFNKGERLCSLLIFPIFTGELEQVDELAQTERGANWDGSSNAFIK